MSDLTRAARDASRAIAKMSGNGRREGSDQRGMAWGDVVAVHNQFVDVMTGGTVSGSLRYTTACDGIAEGDRVLIQHVGREPVVVGIVSKGSQPEEPKRIFTGTKVVNAKGDNSAVVLTNEEIEEMCGRRFASASGDFAAVMNGDGAASPVHIDGCTYLNDSLYATMNAASSANMRVNWIIVLHE